MDKARIPSSSEKKLPTVEEITFSRTNLQWISNNEVLPMRSQTTRSSYAEVVASRSPSNAEVVGIASSRSNSNDEVVGIASSRSNSNAEVVSIASSGSNSNAEVVGIASSRSNSNAEVVRTASSGSNSSNLKGLKTKIGVKYYLNMTKRGNVNKPKTKLRHRTATSSSISTPDPILMPCSSTSSLKQEPKIPTSDTVSQWLNKYVSPVAEETALHDTTMTMASNVVSPVQEETGLHTTKFKPHIKMTRDTTKSTFVCPRCYICVQRLSDHLRKTCMTDAQGYTSEERKNVLKENASRGKLLKRAHIRTSTLRQCTNLNVHDFHMIVHLIEECGVLVRRDVNIDDQAPPSRQDRSTQTLESISKRVDIAPRSRHDRSTQKLKIIQRECSTQTSTVKSQWLPLPVPSESLVEPFLEEEISISAGDVSPASLVDYIPSPRYMSSDDDLIVQKTLVSSPSTNIEKASPETKDICDVSQSNPTLLPTKRNLDLSDNELPLLKKSKSDDSSSGSTICISYPLNYTKSINVKMAQLGFYEKFADGSCPVLHKFDHHLKTTMLIPKELYRNQIVANVNRILYRLHPAFENPNSLANTEAILNYFNQMPSELVASTKTNYIKSLNMFLSYCSQTTSIREKYVTLIEGLPSLRECLASIRIGLSKKTSKRMAERRAAQFRGEKQQCSVADIMKCVETLKKHSKKFLTTTTRLSHENLKSINTYFNAVITLKNAHRPSVFVNMKIEEFLKPVKVEMDNGEVKFSVGVVEHKTATTQLATVSFSESEYEDIKTYIHNIRVKIAKYDSPRNVFLNRNGRKIYNPSSDLHTKQNHLGLPLITSTQARHSYETISSEVLDSQQRQAVANYLAHSIDAANANYVDITEDRIKSMVRAMSILQDPQSWSSRPVSKKVATATAPAEAPVRTPEKINAPLTDVEPATSVEPATDVEASTDDAPLSAQKRKTKFDRKFEDRENLYMAIKEKYKITADMEIPCTRAIKVIATEIEGASSLNASDYKSIRGRLEYDRMLERSKQAVSYFPRLRPSTSEIMKYLQRKDWYNKHTLSFVKKAWNPSHSTSVINTKLEKRIGKKISLQKWNSCVINNEVLHAKRYILKGEIVCDYHADVISHDEGMRRYSSLDDRYRQHMFFFTYGEQKYCLDGNKPCSCHQLPALKIHGRLLEHSIDAANVTPRIYMIDSRPHLLFEAIFNILEGRKICFDSGAPIN